MPFDHSNATATVSIDGLALGCYNLATDTYQVGFIHDENHSLTVSIIEATAGEETITHDFAVDKNHRIFIDAEEGVTPPQPFYISAGAFDRTTQPNQNNDEDFRWILDVDKELNNDQPVPLDLAAMPSIIRAHISKPMLYANKRRFVNGTLNLVNQQDETDKRLFGNLCEAIKGDINCEGGGGVVVRIDGPLGVGRSYPLPHIAGKTHQIVMENRCPAVPGQPTGFRSDFTLVYNVIQDTSGKRFDLKLVNDAHVPDGVCNLNTLGKTGKLFP